MRIVKKGTVKGKLKRNCIYTQPYSYQIELSELFESLSFLQSSSSVLLLDLLGLGGL